MNGDLDAPEPREDEGGATEIGTEGLSPKDFEQIEFATTDGQRPAAVVATFSNPAFPTESAPASLLAGFISEVRGLFRAIGSGFEPQVYQVSATNSMSVYFGEPPVVGAQHELEIGSAANVGHAVADMIGLQGDELFSRAVRLGESSKAYMSFVRFTAQNDVTVRWSVGTTRVVVLPPKRAAAQYERLVAPPAGRWAMCE